MFMLHMQAAGDFRVGTTPRWMDGLGPLETRAQSC